MQDIILFIQHHWMLSAVFVLVLLLLVLVEFLRIQRGTRRISPLQTTQLINHQDAVIVDIRSTEAFLTGHIVGALSIPLADIENKYKKLEKYKTQPMVLICAAGLESPRAANLLIKQGFNVSILAGGIRGWKDADMPLIKGQ